MKILIPHQTESASGGLSKVTSKSLKLSEVTQGHQVGLIPIRMQGSYTKFERLFRVEVSGEASDNGKGYRRVMLKVSIPYHRIWTADPAAAEELREKQEPTSAGSISMHVVLSIPSKVRQDLIESSDVAATHGAESHLVVVGSLLSALTGQIRRLTLAQRIDGQTGVLNSETPSVCTVDEEGNATIGADAGALVRLDAAAVPPAIVDPYDSERFGTVGLDVDPDVGICYLSETPRDPLVRGLFGLVPIEENTNVVAGPSILVRS